MWPMYDRRPKYTTHRTVYRGVHLTVTLRADGTIYNVTIQGTMHGVTELLSDEYKEELAALVRRERESEA